MRNHISILLTKAAYSLVWVGVYVLAVLSGSLGLTKLTKTSFSNWMCIGLALILLLIWSNHKTSLKVVSKLKIESLSKGNFIFFIVLAVMLPVVGEFLINKGVKIPDAPINPFMFIVLDFVLIAASIAVGLVLAYMRSSMLNPLTEVSEYRNHWQENVHPKDIFRSFDMEMSNMRFKEMPNRIYRELNPKLNMEGSMDKGSFIGDTIVETQPIYEEIQYSDMFKNIRFYISVYGGILMALSSFLLFLLNRNASNETLLVYIFNSLYAPVILGAFGRISINIAHLYWAEINFKSYLIHFQGEGTYSESKISTGMAYTDSTRSENQIVRSSFTPWLILSQIKTSTLAGTGVKNLEDTRYVLDMRKDDYVLENLVKGMRTFLEEQQTIANSMSDKDMESIKNIYSVNQVSPANNHGAPKEPILMPYREEQEKLGS